MKLLGFLAVFLQGSFIFAGTNLPAVQTQSVHETYLDVQKPEAFSSLKLAIDGLQHIETQSFKALSIISVLKDGQVSQNQWEDFKVSYIQMALYDKDGTYIQRIINVLRDTFIELQHAHRIANEKHSHYYLKQTTQAHLNYMNSLKLANSQLSSSSEIYSDLKNIEKAILFAVENNFDISDQEFKKAIKSYSLVAASIKNDLQFLKQGLDKAYKTHLHFAKKEQEQSFLSVETERSRLEEIVFKAHRQLQNMANIAKTALNMGAEFTTLELIELISESKKNQRPTYNQLMQILDVEITLKASPLLNNIEYNLKKQAELLDNYLSALEKDLKSGLIDSKPVENKYHSSFFQQMLVQSQTLSTLKCQMLF